VQRLAREHVPLGTEELARFLIGTVLVRQLEDGGGLISGRIVETEAYTPGDPASHAFRGRTERNRTMFGPHFHAYVYFVYGTAYCLNVSSEDAGVGAAVLVRAVEPLSGTAAVRARRGLGVADRDLLRGPGRICVAMDIDRRIDGADLETDPRLWVADDGSAKPAIGVSPRIGLTRAADAPLRFYAQGSRFLSGRRALSPDATSAALTAAQTVAIDSRPPGVI
jgi:DNA-3-methyladenine glycosylase